MKKSRIFFALCVAVFLTIAAFTPYNIYTEFQRQKKNQLLLEKKKAALVILGKKLEAEAANFKGTASIIIQDLENGWEIAINPDGIYPAASLTKIPIMLACFYAAAEQKINLAEKIRLKGRHKVSGSGWLKTRPAGEAFSIVELIGLMISQSDNTAANILIERLGFNYLNDTFKKMGLKATALSRKMMDFKKRKKGIENFTSAKDITLLLNKIYHGAFINRDISGSCLYLLKQQKIRDRIPARLPANTVVAHKTGLEKGVCHDAGIVFSPRGNFIICVLTKHHNKTSRSSKRLIAQIALLAYNCYQGLEQPISRE